MHLIPADRMTPAQIAKKYQDAGGLPIQRAANVNFLDPTNISYRIGDPALDFGCTGRSWWLTATLAVTQTYYSMFTTLAAPAVGLSPVVPVGKVWVAFGVDIKSAPNPVSQLALFWSNVSGAGNLRALFDLECLEPFDHWVGFFDKPIYFAPNDNFNWCVRSKNVLGAVVGVQWPIELYTFVLEPANTTVTM